ncbi:uncharacterized protein BJ212DRAFT_1268954 [Suillus subaureus]|uniref:Transcription factor CBF/NF-Y/archaeal histone domain-containing protein n=1 Tax=Suillus subaureus TaxID=48587 RepID=A0A9P7EDM5_9AGAM|nr:uncharacterized protein BJ212DRAFT_1268954 [Suillus subaureus]KAG1818437.1 hypothetical protein BJ212DRAFT_1268954 [Suillus subaureus]
MVAHTSALQPYGQCSELSGPNPNVSVYDLPTDSENEAEVDELESDTDPEDELAASASAHQKKSGRRLGERVPGTTLLPPSKVENIVQPDSANFSASITMSKEALFVLSVATEEFIKRMAQAGHRQAAAKRRGTVNYSDLACSTQQYQEFMFLQDTIPEPISLAEALDRRAMKEKEDLEANPAMSTTHRQSPPFISAPQLNGKSKAKPRPSVPNGKDTTNASANGNSSREHRRNEDGMDGDVSRSRSTRVAHGDRYAGPEEHASSDVGNETGVYQAASSPRHPTSGLRDTARSPHEFAPNWPGHYTGPASGFLQDPRGGFGRGIASQNPGRTIYSQQSRPENGSYQ